MQLGCQLRLMLGSQELDVYEIVFVICAYGNSLKAGHVLGGQSVHDDAIICGVKNSLKN